MSFFNILDAAELGIDTSQKKIPDDWQRKMIEAGAKGRVPLDVVKLDDGRDAIQVSGIDVSKLKHPDGKVVSQKNLITKCEDTESLETFLNQKASNGRLKIQADVL